MASARRVANEARLQTVEGRIQALEAAQTRIKHKVDELAKPFAAVAEGGKRLGERYAALVEGG
eukprot:7184551-Alexandrium_andersonii.AAC.1